ncbi:MAG: S-adenosylmethionine decarboxylase [Anaerolineae bacterium]|nr:S-adenosylmethionine decarboxylase [Anaerolineae bacterium]
MIQDTVAPPGTDSYKRIQVDGVRYYGKHLILTGMGCNDALLSKETMVDFLKTLADRIDMVRFGEPLVERFGEGIEEGISGVQLIQTSALVTHTNDQARDLYLDVFSCKDFEAEAVMAYVREVYAPANIEFQVFLRK